MDANKILEELLQSGKNAAAKGEELFGERLGIPEAGAERDAMISGLGKGAAAAGVLALLLGTGAGRRLTGTAIKLGSLAAIGGIGYTAFKKWQANNGQLPAGADAGTPVDQLSGEAAQARARALLRAMIAAARADGHIDQEEQAHIESQMSSLDLGEDVAAFIHQELDAPLDAARIAEDADSIEAGIELWLATRTLVDQANSSESDWLDQVTAALKLDANLVAELENQLAAA